LHNIVRHQLIAMPITSAYIPEQEWQHLDSLKTGGLIRHKRDAIARGVYFYRVFDIHLWNPPVLRIGGQRSVFMTEEGVRGASSQISEQKLKQVGIDIGQTFKKHFLIAAHADLSSRQNWSTFLDFLKHLGWGSFTADKNSMVITQAGLPLAIAEGCLQGALDVRLVKVTSNLEKAVLEIRQEV